MSPRSLYSTKLLASSDGSGESDPPAQEYGDETTTMPFPHEDFSLGRAGHIPSFRPQPSSGHDPSPVADDASLASIGLFLIAGFAFMAVLGVTIYGVVKRRKARHQKHRLPMFITAKHAPFGGDRGGETRRLLGPLTPYENFSALHTVSAVELTARGEGEAPSLMAHRFDPGDSQAVAIHSAWNPKFNTHMLTKRVSDVHMTDVPSDADMGGNLGFQEGGTLMEFETDENNSLGFRTPMVPGPSLGNNNVGEAEPMEWQSLQGPVEVENPFAPGISSGPPPLRSSRAIDDDGPKVADTTAAFVLPQVEDKGSSELKSPVEAWEIQPCDIEICTRPNGEPWVLGAGAFGQVFKATLDGLTVVAVKMIRDSVFDTPQLEELRREAAVLCAMRDPHVVSFIGAYLRPAKPAPQGKSIVHPQEGPDNLPPDKKGLNSPMIVTEFMEGGDLRSALSEENSRLQWKSPSGKGAQVACDILRGLHSLHRRGIIHFDLKSPNVLLGPGGRPAKIADVGLAAHLGGSRYVHDPGMRGTFAWVAPEVLVGARKCTEKVDMFSFGVVLWEICTGEAPQRGRLRSVLVPEECPGAVAEMIDACLAVDPALRPSAKEAFFKLSAAAAASSSDENAAGSPRLT